MEYTLKTTLSNPNVPKTDDVKSDIGEAVNNSKQEISKQDIVNNKERKRNKLAQQVRDLKSF